jgi:hypothetical protein
MMGREKMALQGASVLSDNLFTRKFVHQEEASAHDLHGRLTAEAVHTTLTSNHGKGLSVRAKNICLWFGALAGAALQATTPMISVS